MTADRGLLRAVDGKSLVIPSDYFYQVILIWICL
jgi:hypothetical protein